ncbi:hypothetical protein CWRG_02809 [Chthonomonas calidirosea]|uniref:hypothetical protein n=1 Tax=Chthonomonas calidirosea TaxID=454171 RepID=UPI0006DD3915|nr:hypothetical protein [Chthonomonas calidirosea]CEK20365.1 hypothetical protein CWRG_02809 [Chthonomonas calidirosea]
MLHKQQELLTVGQQVGKVSPTNTLPILSETADAAVIESTVSSRDFTNQVPIVRTMEHAATALQDTSSILSAGTSSEMEWTGVLEWAQVRAARHYVLERCKKHVYIECSEVARLTGWSGPRVRRFILEVQDEWRQLQGIRPRGRPRKSL